MDYFKYCNITVKSTSSEAVSLAEAKAHLVVDDDFVDDDAIIQIYIDSATSYASDFINQDILYTENTKEFFEFCGDYLEIEESPYSSIESITATLDGEDTVLVEGTDFSVQIGYSFFKIRFNSDISFDKVSVKFYTGNEYVNVNKTIRQAILILTNDLYDIYRTSGVIGTKFQETDVVKRLLSGHVIKRW